MRSLHVSWLIPAFLVVVAGCQQAAPPPQDPRPTVEVNGANLPVSGPYDHENISVFLIHSKEQDERAFITLDEGLKDGLVLVTEKDQEQVNELQIENKSDYPLFLQEGDRLQGGKQDRTIYASLVLPPHSGKMALPAFCIEQSRWEKGTMGGKFDNVSNFAQAPKQVRCAAKIYKNQSEVWNQVQGQKFAAEKQMLATNANSSLNETLDSPKVKQLSDEFAAALAGVLEQHADAVGFAIVVNGKIEEVNVYPNHDLMKKLYPRLIRSYALQAAVEKDKAPSAAALSCDDLVRFMTEAQVKKTRSDQVNADNGMSIRERSDKSVECNTLYRGAPVHYQLLSDAVKEGQDREQGLNYQRGNVQELEVPAGPNPPPQRQQRAPQQQPNRPER